MKHIGHYLLILAMLSANNYAYQAWRAIPDWHAAFERSYFQLIAVIVCWFFFRVRE